MILMVRIRETGRSQGIASARNVILIAEVHVLVMRDLENCSLGFAAYSNDA